MSRGHDRHQKTTDQLQAADTSREALTACSSTSLQLIPPPLFIDESVSFGSTKLKRALQERGFYVVHVSDESFPTKSDESITREALSSGAAVVTSDSTFVKTALNQGGVCPDITVVIPHLKRDSDFSAALADIADLVESEARSKTAPGYKTLAFVHEHLEGYVIQRQQIPDQIFEVWCLLEARGDTGVSCAELAHRWACSANTAWRRAERFEHAGWLQKRRRGRRVFYAQSWLLRSCLSGLTGVVTTSLG